MLSPEGSVGCDARDKVPRLRGGCMQKTVNATKCSLQDSVGCDAHDKVPELHDDSGRLYMPLNALARGLCWMRRAIRSQGSAATPEDCKRH